MAMPPLSLDTWPGVVLEVVVPSPSSPLAFPPQAQTDPSDWSARLCNVPALMAITPAPLPNPLTPTGVELLVRVPLPNWPKSLDPQAATEPLDLSARLCTPPPAMAITP